jgi:hypothetical protein
MTPSCLNGTFRTGSICFALLLLALAGPAMAQPSPVPPRLPRTDTPPVPAIKSPVEVFRQLLALSPAERKAFLTNRPPEIQKQILAKVREYESLRPTDRELRLQATELRFYLLPVLTSSATNRLAELSHIPDATRKLVIPRIRQWEQLPSEVRQELLDNEAAIRYFTDAAVSTSKTGRASVASLPARNQKLEAGLERWHSLSETERARIEQRFHTFFELSPEEKTRALGSLSAEERQQIDKTLKSFGNLAPPQRMECIRAFNKFTELSVQDRQQFLRNAERWKLLSPEQRQDWRELVSRLAAQPPLPPGVTPGLTLPPIPQPISRTLATNGL